MLWCGTSKKIMKSHSGNVKNGATSPKHKRFERRVWGSVFTESSPSQGRLKQLSLLAKTKFLGSGARCEPPTVYFAANDRARIDTLHIFRADRRVATATDSKAEGTSPRGITCHCTHKADTLHICRAGRRVATAIDSNSPRAHRLEDKRATVYMKPHTSDFLLHSYRAVYHLLRQRLRPPPPPPAFFHAEILCRRRRRRENC
jgi:hypothetical protein